MNLLVENGKVDVSYDQGNTIYSRETHTGPAVRE